MKKFGIAAFMMLSVLAGHAQADTQCQDRSQRLTILVMNIAAAEKAQLEKENQPANDERIAELSHIVRALFDASFDKKSPGATYAEITAILSMIAEMKDAKDVPVARPMSSPVLIEGPVRGRTSIP